MVAGPGAGVDAQPDPAPRWQLGRPPPDALDLAHRVEVDVDRRAEEHVEVALGDVRAGEADLLGSPAVLEGVEDLAGRARVDADGAGLARTAERPERGEDLGLAVGLEREPLADAKAGASERVAEPPHVLAEAVEVVDERGRAHLAGQRLGVAARDPEPAVLDVETRPDPPGRGAQRVAIESSRRREASAISATAASKAWEFFWEGTR